MITSRFRSHGDQCEGNKITKKLSSLHIYSGSKLKVNHEHYLSPDCFLRCANWYAIPVVNGIPLYTLVFLINNDVEGKPSISMSIFRR